VARLREGEQQVRLPAVMPDGRSVVYQIYRGIQLEEREIWWVAVPSGERRFVTAGNSPRYAASGHLLFTSSDGYLMAARFDAERGELTTPPVAVVESLAIGDATGTGGGIAAYSVSDNGSLMYARGDGLGEGRFVWVDRSGGVTVIDSSHVIPPNQGNTGWWLSPDESRIVFNYADESVNSDIRIKHLPDGAEERVTVSEDEDIRPFWNPDGVHVTYFSGPRRAKSVWMTRADGLGSPELVLEDSVGFAQGTWSMDGTWLVLRTTPREPGARGGRDIVAFRPGVDSATAAVVASPDFGEGAPVLSPDGRWLAYFSDDTDRNEVFVVPFPDVTDKIRVSRDGGHTPRWDGSGSELFFVEPGQGVERGKMMAASFEPAEGSAGRPVELFDLPAGVFGGTANDFFDVSRDGQRFLMVQAEVGESVPVLVQNFFEQLKRLVPN